MTKKNEKIAVYAGSFDPLTQGHMWVIEEASKLFDTLIIAIGDNPAKQSAYKLDQRKAMIAQAVQNIKNVRVESFEADFLINYAKSINANYIVRGIRSESDFSFEKGIFHINRDIDSNINTIFLIPPRELIEVSSSMVKGLIGFKNWENIVKKYVPAPVFEIIKKAEEEKAIIRSLETRWHNLFERLLVFDESRVKRFFADLIASYTKDCRSYHNIWHLDKCFAELDTIREQICNFDILELAVFFHDIVYKPTLEDSKKQSADYLKYVLSELKIDGDIIIKAYSYVLFTDHQSVPKEQDAKFLLDIDIAILGAQKTEFEEYETNVRKELRDLSDDKYAKKRIAFIENFLSRENIYLTPHFRKKYEEHARENLTALKTRLESLL